MTVMGKVLELSIAQTAHCSPSATVSPLLTYTLLDHIPRLTLQHKRLDPSNNLILPTCIKLGGKSFTQGLICLTQGHETE